MSKATEALINKIYNAIYNKVFNKTAVNALSKNSRMNVQQNVIKLLSSKKFNEFARLFSIELAKKGLRGTKGLWRKYFETAKKKHVVGIPKTFSAFEANIMKTAVQNNFTMIKSIPERTLEILNHKYTSTLIEEIAKGSLPRGSFRKLLSVHAGKQAKVIARTETAKLQTVITQQRSEDLGSIAYIWLASNDKRTRPSHKAMNGVVVFWKFNKPLLDKMRGHAGEFPNCRCSPLPIFDEDDLTKSRYKVYNYHTDSLIEMSKTELIEALKRGYLTTP